MALLVNNERWKDVTRNLAEQAATLVAMWGERNDEGGNVNLAVRHKGERAIEIVSHSAPDSHYPSVGRHHPSAILMERVIQDVHGLVADGLPDTRPWLDHGFWPHSRARTSYNFKPALGPGVHQIPVGPVHAGTIEPGHFRFSVNGEIIVRLEARLGYVHRDVLGLMRGRAIDDAAALVGRISGDSTVAYAFAFARAVEEALGLTVPARASTLRGIMAELERLANHLGDFGAICNDSGFSLLNTHAAVLRERVLRLAALVFGHRLMMDCIIPGGVLRDLNEEGATALKSGLPSVLATFERLVDLYEKTASLQDRVVGTGRLDPAVASLLGCGGYVGRAAGQDFDARRDMPYAPYDGIDVRVPVLSSADVDARVRVRIAEIQESVRILLCLLDMMPKSSIRAALPNDLTVRSGAALVEGFRGDIFAFVRVCGGRISDVFVRDPSWFLWPALEAAIEGNIIADFPLCNKSFNAAYAGCDL